MTAERFEVVLNEFDEVEYIMDKTMMEDRDFAEFMDFVETVCKENEQLKTTIQQLRTDNTKQKKLLNTTMKENEHIKTTIKDMINTERTEIGKMTLQHLWRQIQ